MVVVLLTLQRHQHGVWITRLVDDLQSLGKETNVLCLEDWLAEEQQRHEQRRQAPPYDLWEVVVNRVSDAAEPALVKACLGLLQVCQHVYKIPVWNGPAAYSLCTNKWSHHVLFDAAGLSTPTTVRVFRQDDFDTTDLVNGLSTPSNKTDRGTNHDQDKQKEAQCLHQLRFPLLIKPNAGGFGAGIVKVESAADLSNQLSFGPDGVCLLQDYVHPHDNELFRVWFLNGRVQCGVVRKQHDPAVFTVGCAGSDQCAFRPKEVLNSTTTTTTTTTTVNPNSIGTTTHVEQTPYDIPKDVRREIEGQLLPLLPDAHCGSVEFLYDTDGVGAVDEHSNGQQTTEMGSGRERLYFDLNLLSTLPLVKNDGNVWSDNFDPWMELAQAISSFADVAVKQQFT